MVGTSSALATLTEAYAAFAQQQTFASRTPASLYDPVRYAMASAGKAVRPTLLLMAHALGSEDASPALPAAYAVELFHNFTLIHDDIMDDASLRRGKPAVHVKYGHASAILSGDAMLIHTYGYLLEQYPPDVAAGLLAEFQPMAVALCEGQQRDMDMEAGANATYAEYLKMIHGKTGVLITAALSMGARLAGLPEASVSAIRWAGDLAGRAFQIQDDLLDTFRSSAVTGKGDYGDIVRGKQSAPYLRYLDLASEADAAEMRTLYALPVEERLVSVGAIREAYSAVGVEEALGAEVVKLSLEASALIGQAEGHEQAKAQLVAFTESLARRAF